MTADFYGISSEWPLKSVSAFILQGDVYFYYGLYNYYQNLRRYMKSRSDAQLIGDLQVIFPLF